MLRIAIPIILGLLISIIINAEVNNQINQLQFSSQVLSNMSNLFVKFIHLVCMDIFNILISISLALCISTSTSVKLQLVAP